MLGRDIIKAALSDLPAQPGIYRMLGENGAILYIGKAKNLQKRVISYTREDLPVRTGRMVFLTRKLEFETTNSEAEALLLEANLIRKHQPKYNILLKDDKSFPYIKLRQDHDFPQILKYRGSKLKDGKFFGPFASVAQLDSALQDIHKIFLLRSCSDNYFADRKRPCLQYQIKRCSAPCTNKISKNEYRQLIDQAEQFLGGKTAEVQKQLQQQMDNCANKLEYEKAANLRDRIKALSYIQMKYHHSSNITDSDVIVATSKHNIYCIYVVIIRGGKNYGGRAYFPSHTNDASLPQVLSSFIGQFYQTHPAPKSILLSHPLPNDEIENIELALKNLFGYKTQILLPKKGDKLALINQTLEAAENSLKSKQREYAKFQNIETELQKLFDIKDEIERIEVYDNSHIMGTHALGGMIVAGPEGFQKQEYRSFNIKSDYAATGGDDYIMLEETLTRRLKRLVKEPYRKPNLIIIDGGKGHLNCARKVFESLEITDITYICMAKGVERNSGREIFHQLGKEPFTLDKNDPTMRYLQILRDEVHNYAITTHRKKRSKAITFSSLEGIPGIGARRNKMLLNHFGSLKAITNATINDLCRVDGISKTLAEEILEHLK